jgi:hypothetical protein
MRRILAFTLVLLAFMAPVALAQQLYTHEKLDYSFEIPSANWKAIIEPDPANDHPEFVYGDRLDGYLTIRKEIVDAALLPANSQNVMRISDCDFCPALSKANRSLSMAASTVSRCRTSL